MAATRRTQTERREATIAALVVAAAESLAELGYARTSTIEIARRAGVSQGGLFRHFESRLDLILAAADEVRSRQFDDFRLGLAALDEFSVSACLTLLRRATRAPMNAAWYELLVAARTDADLRQRLTPLAERYHREIIEIGHALPIAESMPSDELDTMILGVVHMLDGEAITSVVLAHPEHEDLRLEQLVRILAGQRLFDSESAESAHR
ncbi:TetR/AcrR family transcriptional regulator [Aeromicrobium sp. A1-2]|uniref:TetR/AcrR family transcriptional regulator n=1 Tax=Aeromicrobium sp. A1-2 TaxID=2107713 RepID=UPI000E47916B|nr:TetR/AcrR family transcriptional regulator [Aeromicrobium sp. A1-2]AXT86270.1 TetR/AcrR family transcriptional regulator [Aeromicrobium sp. A1-2]